MVECLVGKVRRQVDIGDAAEGEIRFDTLVGGGVERLHGAFAGRDFTVADQEVSSQFHV
ncbi:hypothetical protein D3C85_1933170 [compost metagenome]